MEEYVFLQSGDDMFKLAAELTMQSRQAFEKYEWRGCI